MSFFSRGAFTQLFRCCFQQQAVSNVKNLFLLFFCKLSFLKTSFHKKTVHVIQWANYLLCKYILEQKFTRIHDNFCLLALRCIFQKSRGYKPEGQLNGGKGVGVPLKKMGGASNGPGRGTPSPKLKNQGWQYQRAGIWKLSTATPSYKY